MKRLHAIAQRREQSLSQMAISWLMKDKRVTSVLIGVSSKAQLLDNLQSLDKLHFSETELQEIETVLKG